MKRDGVSGSIQWIDEKLGCSSLVKMEVGFIPGEDFCSVTMSNLPQKVWELLFSGKFKKQLKLAIPSPEGEKKGKYPYSISMWMSPDQVHILITAINKVINSKESL